jgi:hypothetical protein
MIEVGTVGTSVVGEVPDGEVLLEPPLVTEATQLASDWISALESELPNAGIPGPP